MIMKKLLLLLLITLTMGCMKDDVVVEPPIIEPPVVPVSILGIEESDPPFDTDALFFKDYEYGNRERQKLDFILPDNSIGTAILFHGGAYIRYDKDTLYNSEYTELVSKLLDNNVAVVNANYRYLEDVGLQYPLSDGSSVIKFVKENSEVFPGGIVLGGVSAGAGISLHNGLGEHSDVAGIVALDAQASNNVHRWEEAFPGQIDVESLLRIPTFADPYAELYGGYNYYTYREFIETDYINFMDDNDPPIYIYNADRGVLNLFDTDNLYHNQGHAEYLITKATEAGIETTTAPVGIIPFINQTLN